MNSSYPYGKRVSPVDYSLYVVNHPSPTGYVVHNRSNVHNYIDPSGRTLFSSLSPTGYVQRSELRWLHGSNNHGVTKRRMAATRSPLPRPSTSPPIPSAGARRPSTAPARPRGSLTPLRLTALEGTDDDVAADAPAAHVWSAIPDIKRQKRIFVRNDSLVVQENAMLLPESFFIGADADRRMDAPSSLSSSYRKRILRILRGTVVA